MYHFVLSSLPQVINTERTHSTQFLVLGTPLGDSVCREPYPAPSPHITHTRTLPHIYRLPAPQPASIALSAVLAAPLKGSPRPHHWSPHSHQPDSTHTQCACSGRRRRHLCCHCHCLAVLFLPLCRSMRLLGLPHSHPLHHLGRSHHHCPSDSCHDPHHLPRPGGQVGDADSRHHQLQKSEGGRGRGPGSVLQVSTAAGGTGEGWGRGGRKGRGEGGSRKGAC